MINYNAAVKVDDLDFKAIQSLLAPYKSTNFLFWTYRAVGNPIQLSFKIEDIKKLVGNVVVLSGKVILGTEQQSSDIIVKFKLNNNNSYTRMVTFKYKGNRYKYILEPNIQTKALWDDLVNEIECCLIARLKREL